MYAHAMVSSPPGPTVNLTTLRAALVSKSALLWYAPLLLFVIERSFWPLVASWREDEATVMWIARHFGATELTVGLVSSTGLPNPVGLVWIAKLLTFAPDLYFTGLFLQLIHLGVLLAICVSVARRVSTSAGLGLFVLIGCLMAYRSSGSEPFSQWLMLPTTLACTWAFVLCVTEPSFAKLFVLLALLWLPPALYIAGVLNSAVFVLALGAYATNASFRRRLRESKLQRPLLAFLIWSALQLLLVWRPYFSVVSLSDLRAVSTLPLGERVQRALLELVRAPLWLWGPACDPDFRPSLYIDPRIVASPWFTILGHASQWLFRGLMVAAVAAANRAQIWRDRSRFSWVLWPLCLLWLALVCSPLLGGPSLSRGERLDIGYQFVPLVLIPIAVCLTAPSLPRAARLGAGALGVSFGLAEMLAGVIALVAHDHYSGDALSDADVPLRHKMEVIDTIVRDASARHIGPEIPIDYVVDGHWRWIRRYHPKVLEHYGSPYTLGRAFDYDLERRYGIKNALEGRRRKPPRWGFWVNYRFEPPLERRGDVLSEIGRLRVGFKPERGTAASASN